MLPNAAVKPERAFSRAIGLNGLLAGAELKRSDLPPLLHTFEAINKLKPKTVAVPERKDSEHHRSYSDERPKRTSPQTQPHEASSRAYN
jgi:hypothetical protein